jgi:aspartate kinase
LYVKSFIDPHAEGTAIQASDEFDHLIPSFIIKKEQALLSITPKDFSFIVEENLSDIFTILAGLGITINLMQNSALSFSIVFDDKKNNVERVIQAFEKDFELELTKSTELVTIRHYDNATIDLVTKGKAILVEQRIKDTVRMILN